MIIGEIEVEHGNSVSTEIFLGSSADMHWRPAAQLQEGSSAGAVRCDLEVLAAPEERAQLARRDIGVGGHDASDGVRTDADVETAAPIAGRNLLERLAIDISDQVAEPIDAQHLSGDLIVGHARL